MAHVVVCLTFNSGTAASRGRRRHAARHSNAMDGKRAVALMLPVHHSMQDRVVVSSAIDDDGDA